MSDINEKLSMKSFDERLKDLRILYSLEELCVSGKRLDVKSAITLSSLRVTYPGSARRFRDEIIMGEHDIEGIIEFAVHLEDPLQDKRKVSDYLADMGLVDLRQSDEYDADDFST